MSSVSFWGVGKSPMSVIPYGWVPSEKTHTRYLSLTTSYLPTPFLWTRVVMRQHGRWGLISTNRVTGINCFIGVTVGTRTEGLLHACVLWCQWRPWFLFITTTIQCQAVIMILITLWHPGDVRHMHATELRPRFQCVNARLRPDPQPAMGHTPLISSLCQLLLKPICHKERDKRKRRERRAEGERVSMQNRGWGAVWMGKR